RGPSVRDPLAVAAAVAVVVGGRDDIVVHPQPGARRLVGRGEVVHLEPAGLSVPARSPGEIDVGMHAAMLAPPGPSALGARASRGATWRRLHGGAMTTARISPAAPGVE